jgi:hypothetical protein
MSTPASAPADGRRSRLLFATAFGVPQVTVPPQDSLSGGHRFLRLRRYGFVTCKVGFKCGCGPAGHRGGTGCGFTGAAGPGRGRPTGGKLGRPDRCPAALVAPVSTAALLYRVSSQSGTRVAAPGAVTTTQIHGRRGSVGFGDGRFRKR